MKPVRSALKAIILLALLSTFAQPQSLPNLALTRLNYTVTKRRVNPQGELKAKIDAVDSQLASATSQGQTGEVRRLIANGDPTWFELVPSATRRAAEQLDLRRRLLELRE